MNEVLKNKMQYLDWLKSYFIAATIVERYKQ